MRNGYQLVVVRYPEKELIYTDHHNVLRTTDAVSQEEADAEALAMMAKRMKFDARRMRKETR